MVLIDLLELYKWLIIIGALLSWLPGVANSALGRGLLRVTQPVFNFFDRIIPPIFGISLSPVWAFIVIDLLEYGIGAIF
ncbi:YggT family protein [Lactobacillus sp. DCY120]|uniref:YggT family protein n=1 Tax=Bombilactobacillus apium TaxID=2675299 RepID=A0A850R0Y3_9LACO|nr:YggT family protein [Bombilactobacillus apium]